MVPRRIELPAGLQQGTVNVYLFTEPEPVLIDAGVSSDESWVALAAGLAANGLAVQDLVRVVITHAHVDHYGGAGRIAAHSDADVWISELGLPWLEATAVFWRQRLEFYRDQFLPAVGLNSRLIDMALAGMQAIAAQSDPIPPERIHAFPLSSTLMLGGQRWQIIHTPGHASMHTVFHQPESRQLMAGDMLLRVAPTPVVEQPPQGQNARVPALPQFLHSLDCLERLDIEAVYPGHGRPFGTRFGSDHRAIIQRQRDRIQERKGECLAHIAAGHHTPVALLDQMYGHRPIETRFAGLWMLIGYLDLLLAEGAITRSTVDGVWHFNIAD